MVIVLVDVAVIVVMGWYCKAQTFLTAAKDGRESSARARLFPAILVLQLRKAKWAKIRRAHGLLTSIK